MGMNCLEADAIMYAFVDGELSGPDRAAYEAHLDSCDACARTTRLQARFKAALRGHLPRPEVSPKAVIMQPRTKPVEQPAMNADKISAKGA